MSINSFRTYLEFYGDYLRLLLVVPLSNLFINTMSLMCDKFCIDTIYAVDIEAIECILLRSCIMGVSLNPYNMIKPLKKKIVKPCLFHLNI